MNDGLEIEDYIEFKRDFPKVEAQCQSIIELAFPDSYRDYDFYEVCQFEVGDSILVQYCHEENDCIDIRFRFTEKWEFLSCEWEED